MSKISDKYLVLCIYLVLAATTFTVYWQLHSHDFINYDDPVYVSGNSQVKAGLTREGIIWAFTTGHSANWHPLTWLSHMLDCQLFGTNPAWHHLTNLLLHIANTLLLFFVLRQMTAALWQSAFVAAAFALHPLHVESVAWVAERKDVLSTLFWLLTMAAYASYARRPRAGRYLLVLLLFALGLMAKPMLVTLPFVLLLLDYWPLERFQLNQNVPFQWSVVSRLILEKVPFFVLSAISSVITFFVQQISGAVAAIAKLSLYLRIANAVISYLRYIGKMIWPSHLAVFYPLPLNTIPIWKIIIAFLLLMGISVWVTRFGLRYKYLLTGWLWYLGTLVPVIGLVQVGDQASADRYTYVPLTGLFIIVAWGASDLLAKWKYRKITLGMLSLAVLLVLSICTWFQVRYWNSGLTLFEHALKVTRNNYVAHNSLAYWLYRQGKIDEALAHNAEAVRINSYYSVAHTGLGICLAQRDRLDEAISHFRWALQLKPNCPETYYNLGVAMAAQAKNGDAIKCYRQAVRFKPDYFEAHNNMAIMLAAQGELDEAASHYRKALQIMPNSAEAHNNLGTVLVAQGKLDEAISHYRQALQLMPDFGNAHNNFGVALARQGKLEEAIAHFNDALRINPDWPDAMNNLAWFLAVRKGTEFYNPQQSIQLAQRACELTKYQNPDMIDTLAVACAAAGRFSEAVLTAEKALKLAESMQQMDKVEEIRSRLSLYKKAQPYIEPPPK